MLFQPKEKGPTFSSEAPEEALQLPIAEQINNSKAVQKRIRKQMRTPILVLLVTGLPWIAFRLFCGLLLLPWLDWVLLIVAWMPMLFWLKILVDDDIHEEDKQDELQQASK